MAVLTSEHVQGRLDSAEQVEAALDRLKHECLRQIAAGKKVFIQ